jgi:ubiquinone/menaquinone biosynthesis C-methylase UbiE
MDNRIESLPTNPHVMRFDRWAPKYEQSFLQRWFFDPVHSKMLDLLAREGCVNRPSKILDVGCGTGRLLRAASARWPAAQLLGVDPAQGMVMEARRFAPNAIFHLAAAEALPFPDQTVDVVLSSISFHHWADQQKGLQEIDRVLRPGGWLCLANHIVQLTKLFGEKPQSRGQIRALMTGAGLAIRRQQTMGLRFVLITLAQK